MKATFLLGRLILGGFFLYNGIHHFTDRKMLAGYAGAKKVPAPDVAVALSGAMLTLGGASVLLGIRPKIGAGLIIGFLASVSPMIHDFWRAEDPAQRNGDMIHFMKNVALAGGALALAGIEEPWPASLPAAHPSRLERVRQLACKRLAA